VEKMRLTPNIIYRDDFKYMRNLIHTLNKCSDEIILVAEYEEDELCQFLKGYPKVRRVVHPMNKNESGKRNAGVKATKDGDWILRVDSDEIPNDYFIKNIRDVLTYVEGRNNVDRCLMPIFHLHNFSICSEIIGVELRLFRKNSLTEYKGIIHAVPHGAFIGHGISLPDQFSLIHFKFFDKTKMDLRNPWCKAEEEYHNYFREVRMKEAGVFLPPHITYTLTDELRKHLDENRYDWKV
jgi:glycosyltransferase involved in cell wall biosynthesis